MPPPRSGNPAAAQRSVLYLLTDELSSVLVRGQLAFLTDHGFDVTVATRPGDRMTSVTDRWDPGVTVCHLPFVREPSPIADVQALVATVRLIRRRRPTVVHASTPKAGLLGMVAARMCRVPVRVTVVRGLRSETATGWRGRLVRWSERVTIGAATDVVFNSASLRALTEADGLIAEGRGVVFGHGSGNGVDLVRFSPAGMPSRSDAREALGLPDDVVVVGFVGRFTSDKGVDELVRIFDERLRELDVRLLLVGHFEAGDPLEPAIVAMIDDDERIVVVPWLEDTTLAYASIDVLAFPSHREGLPNVVLEAQACGVPVVGYSATGTVDAVDEGVTATLVPVGDTAALCQSLSDLIDDPDARTRMGNAGRAWVAVRFDREAIWTALLELFDRRLDETRIVDDG